MADPTPDDVERARRLWWDMPTGDIDAAVQYLAQALVDERDVVCVADAAAALGVTRQRVLQMIDEGKLPSTRFGRAHAIPRSALEVRASL